LYSSLVLAICTPLTCFLWAPFPFPAPAIDGEANLPINGIGEPADSSSENVDFLDVMIPVAQGEYPRAVTKPPRSPTLLAGLGRLVLCLGNVRVALVRHLAYVVAKRGELLLNLRDEVVGVFLNQLVVQIKNDVVPPRSPIRTTKIGWVLISSEVGLENFKQVLVLDGRNWLPIRKTYLKYHFSALSFR
jgi:hypothetical protein